MRRLPSPLCFRSKRKLFHGGGDLFPLLFRVGKPVKGNVVFHKLREGSGGEAVDIHPRVVLAGNKGEQPRRGRGLSCVVDVPAEGKGEFMTTAQISERLVTYGNIKKPMALSRLGMVLGAHGFTKKMIGAKRLRGWLVYQRDTDEINAKRSLYAKY